MAVFNAALSLSQVTALYNAAAGLPVIDTQPASQTNYDGQTAHFSVSAHGIGTLTYQWAAGTTGSGGPYTNLSDGVQISGSTNATLTIHAVTNANALDYVAIVTDTYGSVTSSPASLVVLPVPQVTITITNTAGSITLAWPQGTLLQSSNLLGPWVTNSSPSPYTVTATNRQMYFKVVNSF